MTAIPGKTAADPQQIIAELERKLDERTSERDEALERQTATADILQVIARSPSDVQPVFDAVAERAMSLLDCWSVLVTRFDGEHVHFGAARGALPDTEKFVRQRYPMRPNRETSLLGRSLLERTVVSSTDVQAEADPQLREYARMRGFHGELVVPLLRDDKVEGALVLTRRREAVERKRGRVGQRHTSALIDARRQSNFPLRASFLTITTATIPGSHPDCRALLVKIVTLHSMTYDRSNTHLHREMLPRKLESRGST
jgi:transcriptional regulator with GAF, ATPase, and Fis domain